MKRILSLVALMTIATISYAQQNISTNNLADFTTVDVTGKLQVVLKKADTTKMEAKINNALADKLEWSVKNGTLSVRLRPGSSSEANGEVVIYYKNLTAIKVSASSLSVEGVVEAKILDIELSSGATVSAELKTQDALISAAGNSAANITGETNYLTVSANMKSKVNTQGLEADDARVEAATYAEVFVTSSQRVVIVSDSGAAVFYKGEPEIVRTTTRLKGTINSIGK